MTRVLLAAFCVLLTAAPASAECAWVMWEHYTGVMRGKAEDFWLLRAAEDTRAECLRRAEQEVKVQTGDQPESLAGMMAKAEIRPGWSRQIETPWAYVERAPEGQREFMRRELQCWPSGTDPSRPKAK
jgi:hypothetical protein